MEKLSECWQTFRKMPEGQREKERAKIIIEKKLERAFWLIKFHHYCSFHLTMRIKYSLRVPSPAPPNLEKIITSERENKIRFVNVFLYASLSCVLSLTTTA